MSGPHLDLPPAAASPRGQRWAIALALGGALAMLGPALFSLDPIYGFDTVHEKYFWREWVFGRLRSGELPTWCAQVLGGIPIIAEPIVSFWYAPVALLHLLLPTGVALNLTWFLHFVIAALGGYVLLVGRVGTRAALFGSASYAFGAWMVGHIPLGGLPHFAACAWTPWVFWSVLRIVESDRAASGRDVALVALCTAACILGGHLQFVYATGLMVGLFLLLAVPWLRREDAARRPAQIGLLVGALALALGLAAVMLLPWWEFHGSSRRAAGLPEQFAYFGARMVPIQLFSVLAPTFFGDSVHEGYWGFPTQGMVTPYVGIPALVLALACRPPRARRREAWALRALAALGLVLAFGHVTPLYDLARSWIPFFDQARHPARWLHLTVFALAWLAGLGFAGWRERSDGRVEAGVAIAVMAVSLVLCSGLARGDGAEGPWRTLFEQRVDETTLPGRDPLRTRDPQALEIARDRSLRSLDGAAVLASLTALLLVAPYFAARRGPLHARSTVGRSGAALVLLLLADLIGYGHRYAISFPRSEIAGDPRLVSMLGPPDPEQRVMSSVRGRNFPFPASFARSHAGLSGIGQAWMHRPMTTGHLSAQGVFPTTPARWRDLIVGPFAFDPGDDIVEPQGVRDLVAVATWLAPAHEAPDAPGWSLVGEREEVRVWRRDAPLSRAFLVARCEAHENDDAVLRALRDPGFDPREVVHLSGNCPPEITGTAGEVSSHILSASDRHVEIRSASEGPALLVLSDNHFPGWTAHVDGQPVEILRVNLALRGVVLPAGEHAVRFDYRPTQQFRGAVVTGGAGAVILWLWWGPRRRRRAP